jgi:hypothetical protein
VCEECAVDVRRHVRVLFLLMIMSVGGGADCWIREIGEIRSVLIELFVLRDRLVCLIDFSGLLTGLLSLLDRFQRFVDWTA